MDVTPAEGEVSNWKNLCYLVFSFKEEDIDVFSPFTFPASIQRKSSIWWAWCVGLHGTALSLLPHVLHLQYVLLKLFRCIKWFVCLLKAYSSQCMQTFRVQGVFCGPEPFTHELPSVAFLLHQFPFFAVYFGSYCRFLPSLPVYKQQALQYVFGLV